MRAGRAAAGFVLIASLLGPWLPAQEATPAQLERSPWVDQDLAAQVRVRLGAGRERRADERPSPAHSPSREVSKKEEEPADGDSLGDGASRFLGLAVLAIAMVAAIVAIARHLRRSRQSPDPAAAPGGDVGGSLLKEGDERRAAGDVAGALLAYYRHAIERLRTSGRIRNAPHLTDGLIAVDLEGEELRRPFRALSALFQPVRYGDAPPAAGGADEARGHAVALDLALAPDPPSGAGSAR